MPGKRPRSPERRPGHVEGPERISPDDFSRLRDLITAHCGIRLPDHKKSMLEVRLRRRLRTLGMESFDAYTDFLFNPEGMKSEFSSLIDAVTTNKTDFFREAAHFSFLAETAIPRLVNSYGAGASRPLRAWSAGCATGEEAYSMAMVFSEATAGYPDFRYSILGTDISTRVLEVARLGVYQEERIGPVPPQLRKKYLLRSRDPERQLIRIAPELRHAVQFRQLNFMASDYGIREPIDVIFCRNVLIYFERSQQEQILGKLCRHLLPGRYLFTGHSESIAAMDLPLEPVAPSVYRRI